MSDGYDVNKEENIPSDQDSTYQNNRFNNRSNSARKVFEEAKQKQKIIPQITKIAIKAICLGIILMIFIETYYIFFIKDISAFDIIINISLTVVVFFIATAYLLHELEKAGKSVEDAHEIIETLINNLEMIIRDRTNEIKQLLQQKNEFINTLSHDLKNPLGPIINLLPVLEKKVTDSESKQILDVLNRNVTYMRNLVDKTIKLAYLNSPRCMYKMEKIDLFKESTDFIKNYQLLLKKNKIDIENKITENMMVEVDKLQINELFDNLILNAANHTDEFGKITIDAQQYDGTITVSIHDTGEGMTQDQQRYVFEEFYKVDESRHDFNTSGLGLSICKRIVEKHGGEIWVESAGLGKGTTFYFTLPVSQKDISKDMYRKIDAMLLNNY